MFTPSSLQTAEPLVLLKQFLKFHLSTSACGVILNLTTFACHLFATLPLPLSILIWLQSGGVLSITYLPDVLSVALPLESIACPLIT